MLMSRQQLMHWNSSEARWHKRYRGQSYAVSPRQLGCDRSKEASRIAANLWWERKQAEIDAAVFAGSDAGRALTAATASADASLAQAKQLRDADRYTLWQPVAD